MQEFEFKMIQSTIFKKIEQEVKPLIEKWLNDEEVLRDYYRLEIAINSQLDTLKNLHNEASKTLPWIDFARPLSWNNCSPKSKNTLRVKDDLKWCLACYDLVNELTIINRSSVNNRGPIIIIELLETTHEKLIDSLDDLEEFGLTLNHC